MKTLAILFSFLIVWLAPLPGAAATVSYMNLTRAETAREYYRTKGASHLGRLVHLHVSATTFREKGPCPRSLARRGFVIHLDHGIPMLVERTDVYYGHLLRNLHRTNQVCVKGRVARGTGADDPIYLRIHRLKRVPGAWR